MKKRRPAGYIEPMGRVILFQPPLEVSRDFVDYPYHGDLSVVQGAAVLREAGMPVEVVDAFALPDSGLYETGAERVLLGSPVASALAAVSRAAERSGDEPDLIVVSYSPFNRPPGRDTLLASVMAAIRGRWPSVCVLLADLYQGGQHYISAAGDAVLEAYPEVDALLQHEAEVLLANICRDLLSKGRPIERWARTGGEIPDPAALPVPAWDLIDLYARDEFFRKVASGLGRGEWAFPIDGRTLPIITSRGCPYDCAHCSSNPGRGSGAKRQRRHSPESLRRLVDTTAEQFGATRIHILDEMANVNRDHFDAVLKALSGHEAGYELPNGLRADHITDEQLDAMAGRITTLSVSAESGAQRVLDEVVRKDLRLDRLEDVLKKARKRSIPSLVHFIVGMPGETGEEINQTLETALRLYEKYGASPSVQYATPLPGTRLAEQAKVSPPADCDWSPLFQHQPVTHGRGFGPEDLRWFKWTFEQRVAAFSGTTKVILNVTYRCNNNCVFCAVGNRTKMHGSLNRQQQALTRYREQGITQLDVDGGEPTLYPDLLRIVRYARDIGYASVNVTTNGRRCAYESYAGSLLGSGVTSLLFSLHGASAETHAENVGVPEAFEQTLEGIRNCVRMGVPGLELGMNVTVTKSNVSELQQIAELAWSLGLRWLNIQFLTPFGLATRKVSPDLALASREASKVLDAWKDRMKIQVINLPFCFMPGHEKHMMGDLLKIQRNMVFVTNDEVNLHEYLRERRRHGEQCAGCRFRVFCGGFFDLEEAPEPPWVFDSADVDQDPSDPV